MQKKRRLRVAFVRQPWETAFPPHSSIALWTYEVARRLQGQCDVLTYAKSDLGQPAIACDEGLQYRLILLRGDLRVLSGLERLARYRGPLRRPFASPLYYLGYILQVAQDVRVQQADIVHIHNFSQFVPIVRALNPRVKIVLHMHCEWLSQLDKAVIARRLRGADLIIGCSEHIVEKIRHRFPQYADRCHTVFNGVDIERFRRAAAHSPNRNGNKRLLFVGRVSPEKGVHVLVDAFRNVATRYPHAQLEIVGPPWQTPIEFITTLDEGRQVAELTAFYDGTSYIDHVKARVPPGIAEQVHFTGFVDHPELARHYHGVDVLINPSFSEAFGMSLIEAMAMEAPVVATRVGGMPEIVEHGKNGLLVEPGDSHALADAILRILSDESAQITMGASGRQKALEQFSWEQVTGRLLTLYQGEGVTR
jgi:glycosyltransferase involved in cell wall biosynthesis